MAEPSAKKDMGPDEMNDEKPIKEKTLKRKLPADFDDPIPQHSDVPAYREFWQMPIKMLEIEIQKLCKLPNGPVDPEVYGEMMRVLCTRKAKKEAAAYDWNNFSDDSDGTVVDDSAAKKNYGSYGLKDWEQSEDEYYSHEFDDTETGAMRGGKAEVQDSEEEDTKEEKKSLSKALSGSDDQEEPGLKEDDEDLLRALAALDVACLNFLKEEKASVTGFE